MQYSGNIEDFERRGFNEDFVRNSLLPEVGLPGYRGDISFTIRPLVGSLSLSTQVYEVIIKKNGGGRDPYRFILKKHMGEGEGASGLHGQRLPPMRERFLAEVQALKNIGSPRVLATNGQYGWFVMEAWEGSLDGLLTDIYTEQGKGNLSAHEAKEKMKEYVTEANKALLCASKTLTEAIEDWNLTKMPPERRYTDYKKRELKDGFNQIIDYSLEESPESEKRRVWGEINVHMQMHRALNNELLALAGYLAPRDESGEIVHDDYRSPNVIYRRKPTSTQRFPPISHIEFTPCDYVDFRRRGPISYSLASLVNDTYALLFLPTREERLELFKRAMVEVSLIPSLTGSQRMRKEKTIEELCETTFVLGTTAGTLICGGKQVARERKLKEKMGPFTAQRPWEAIPQNTIVRIGTFLETLESTTHFKMIRDYLGQALKRLEKIKGGEKKNGENTDHRKEQTAYGR